MKHRIEGLRWAKRLIAKPTCIPRGRPRGAKAQGLRYERVLLRAIPQAEAGVWFEYEDVAGHGYCQVDGLLPMGNTLVVLEAKYTWTAEGHRELDGLYLPVVERALARSAIGVEVCKVLTPDALKCARVGRDLGELVESGRGWRVLHWIGTGPIWARNSDSRVAHGSNNSPALALASSFH